LGNAFLNWFGCIVNQIFGFLETQTGDLANDLDNINLLVANGSEDNVKFCLLFYSCFSTASSGSSSNCHRSGGRYAKLLLHSLNQFAEFQYSHIFNRLQNFVSRHLYTLLKFANFTKHLLLLSSSALPPVRKQ